MHPWGEGGGGHLCIPHVIRSISRCGTPATCPSATEPASAAFEVRDAPFKNMFEAALRSRPERVTWDGRGQYCKRVCTGRAQRRPYQHRTPSAVGGLPAAVGGQPTAVGGHCAWYRRAVVLCKTDTKTVSVLGDRPGSASASNASDFCA